MTDVSLAFSPGSVTVLLYIQVQIYTYACLNLLISGTEGYVTSFNLTWLVNFSLVIMIVSLCQNEKELFDSAHWTDKYSDQ